MQSTRGTRMRPSRRLISRDSRPSGRRSTVHRDEAIAHRESGARRGRALRNADDDERVAESERARDLLLIGSEGVNVRETSTHARHKRRAAERSGCHQEGVADVIDALLLAEVRLDGVLLLLLELPRGDGLWSDGTDLCSRLRARHQRRGEHRGKKCSVETRHAKPYPRQRERSRRSSSPVPAS